jgi:uncharacterized membrane protein
VLSFTYVGICWNKHHHLFRSAKQVSAGNLWRISNHFAPTPTAAYGVVLLMAAIAYYVLHCAIIDRQGPNSLLASALVPDRPIERVSDKHQP